MSRNQDVRADPILSGRPIRCTPLGPKTNYIVNLNNFSTTEAILDLKVSLDRARQDKKTSSQG